ncbi:phosphoglycerate kinase [Algihabitans albus]|uniref:phosphoglycerate kinase n=1 Tax=Algihabitans albus TaxID=2164067 RepID=UPI000E5C960C|nr:phosphoglycerate kinase [Algihabitans albus]
MPSFKTIDDLQVSGKTALVRVDYNVPLRDGRITDTTRILRSKQTVDDLVGRGAKVVLLAHFGRPKGKADPEMSLRPVAEAAAGVLNRPVAFAEDCVGRTAKDAVNKLAPGEVLLLENLRFHAGEEANGPDFADSLADLGDLYIDDAFSAAHRAHASVDGLARRLPAAAGRLMQQELEALSKALERPERPVAAIVGGAKVSTKLDLLGNLVGKVQLLVVGGGMANTFLHALGVDVGTSLCETEMADTVTEIVKIAKANDCDILLPTDALVAKSLTANAVHDTVSVKDVPADRMILDIGPATAEHIVKRLGSCKTVVWNGPLGAFEVPPFDSGTNLVARAVADYSRAGRLLTVAGGGDTVSALANAKALEHFSYVSTAGGAFLEWLEGKTLPGVKALEDAA